jgi:hypothetical protein
VTARYHSVIHVVKGTNEREKKENGNESYITFIKDVFVYFENVNC